MTIIKEVEISVQPVRVYRALTTASELDSWFSQRTVVDVRPGGAYSNGDGDRGSFLEAVAPERLRFTWDNPGHAPGTVVEILLASTGAATTLTLIHSGFRNERDADHYASRESGWDWALENLKAYLEGRPTTDYEPWLKTLG